MLKKRLISNGMMRVTENFMILYASLFDKILQLATGAFPVKL